MKKNINKAIKDALIKKAMGYTTTEVIEEYSNTEDGMVLQKKKVTSKDIPPDITSFKALLDIEGRPNEFEAMTDEMLIEEKERLIKLIRSENEK